MTTNHVLFSEEQQFRQPWLWTLLVLGLVPAPLVFGYGVYHQMIRGQPWGDAPMSNAELVIFAAVTTLFAAGLLAFFWTARLITVVQSDGLLVRFKPLHFSPKRIDLSDVEAVESVTYAPILQYGGWGLRYTLRSKAYNVSGNKGVRLTLRSGRSLLIGSQRADELAAAVRQVWSTAEAKEI